MRVRTLHSRREQPSGGSNTAEVGLEAARVNPNTDSLVRCAERSGCTSSMTVRTAHGRCLSPLAQYSSRRRRAACLRSWRPARRSSALRYSIHDAPLCEMASTIGVFIRRQQRTAIWRTCEGAGAVSQTGAGSVRTAVGSAAMPAPCSATRGCATAFWIESAACGPAANG